jgi:hypothetical protein
LEEKGKAVEEEEQRIKSCLIFFQSILFYPLSFLLIILFRHNIILTSNTTERNHKESKEREFDIYR